MFARNEFFTAQIGELNRFTAAPGMVLGHRNDHLVVPDLFENQPRVVALEADESDLDLAIQQIGDDPGGVADAQDRFYLGYFLMNSPSFSGKRYSPGMLLPPTQSSPLSVP